ncbi:MAG TPA: hypothetical protein VJT50_09170 [Pyrinomonadaceae bacterium]|nr:hypothetical protein [Pyrinomonadaceae bacterium]
MNKLTLAVLVSLLCGHLFVAAAVTPAVENDFDEVVKVIEQHYHVKHKSLPFLARTGIKAATTAAKLAGGRKRQIAEAGSVKIAYFENQEFTSAGAAEFRRNLKAALIPEWVPFVQVLSPDEELQNYVFLREAREKFNLLVVTIEKHDATVVQVDVSPQTLARLMQNPNDIGKSITDEVTTADN